jgi:hypothetical protein
MSSTLGFVRSLQEVIGILIITDKSAHSEEEKEERIPQEERCQGNL